MKATRALTITAFAGLSLIIIDNITTTTKNMATLTRSESDRKPPSHVKYSWSLRYDWTSLEPLSPLAKRLVQHQTNCSLPFANYGHRPFVGLGSDLHVWGQALCNALELNYRIRTIQPWIWWDQDACVTGSTDSTMTLNSNSARDNTTTTDNTTEVTTLISEGRKFEYPSTSLLVSSMTCYFPKAENLCPNNDHELITQSPTYDYQKIPSINRNYNLIQYKCPSIMNDLQSRLTYRIAATEFLFTSVSPLVQQEAERQAALVFKNLSSIPKNLITVHIRWGDKKTEMRLVGIEKYIKAVNDILESRRSTTKTRTNNTNDDDDTVNIFLSSADHNAVELFQAYSPSNWNIYIDQYFVETVEHLVRGYNENTKTAAKLRGRGGLLALGSLLVAMEANDFILTTGSNWSRLLNELRLSVINPRCNNCTSMIDLNSARRGIGW